MNVGVRFLRAVFLIAFVWTGSVTSVAQKNGDGGITVGGSVQSDVLVPKEDRKIGTGSYDEWALTNTYADACLTSKYVDVGVRMEYLEHPLPGFENKFKGWGLGNAYVRLHTKHVDVTLGNFYEQFGSGFILRTYEERSLGIDNSLLGARIALKPVNGVVVKALAGRQRRYWSYNDAIVSGADIELNIEQWVKSMRDNDTYLSVGASWVNKHEDEENIMADATHKYNLPTFVNAFDIRMRLQHNSWSLLAEYAGKGQDPSFDNGYSYDRGHAMMLSMSYSKRGLSMMVQAKRSENMAFRSRRSISGISSMINHLPAFTMDHTYTLAALYPYATNPDGEWAWQAALGYKIKRGTLLGGRYGTSVKANISHVRDNGETFYQDINVSMERRLSRSVTLGMMYMNQHYNKTVVEGEGGMVCSDIFVAEGKWKMSRKATLRSELQYLTTPDDQGDWLFALAELSLQPHWMITLSDEYNCGATVIHYYSGLITFNTGAHRIHLGYGRTRAGYNCAGGVCRYVPASRGVRLSYNYNF